MKIIKLQAENVKKIKAIEITPEGNTVVISGKNGQGKTSVLDSIWFALGGGDASKETIRPVRDGAEKATITIDLGDIVVTRKWSNNEKTSLEVKNKDGAKYGSPQKMLDALVGRLSFDPLSFVSVDNKTQLKTLLDLIELPINPDELDLQIKAIYDQRTFINREIKQLEGQISGIDKPAAGIPEEEVSSGDVLVELMQAQEQKRLNDEKRNTLRELAQKVTSSKEQVDRLKMQIEELNRRHREEISKLEGLIQDKNTDITEITKEGTRLKAEVQKLTDPDIESFQQKLSNVEDINRQVRNAKLYHHTELGIADKKKESQQLSDKIADIEKQKADALKSAKFPIEGLGFNQHGVTFNGIPFKQCSAAERLRVSLAMAMALNPKLKVIRITDGSLLDKDSMKLIENMAKDKDYQVWIEVVDESGSLGIYIEDGEVRNKRKENE